MKQGWEIKKLGEVADVGAGNSAPQKKELFENGKFPFFRTSDVGQIRKGFIETSVDYLNDKGIKGLKLFQKGTILFPKSGASTFLNHRVMMNVDGYVSSHLATIKAKSQIADDRFLLYYLITIDAKDLMQDIAYPSLKTSDIGLIPIPLPPLSEQRRIVSILDESFAVIERSRNAAIQNLKNAKELYDCVLDSILYNKKWKIEQLGNVCEKVEYGTSSKAKSEGQLPVLRMGNIQNGRFTWDSLVYSDNAEDNKQYLLRHNDVLFNRTNSPELVGKTAIYKSEMPAIFAGYLIRIHRKEDLLDADYLNYYLNSKMAFEYGKTVVISSVNQANINGTKLKTYPIPLPSLKEQQTIVRQLDALRAETQKLEAVYQKKIDDLEELKKSILDKAFSGTLETSRDAVVRVARVPRN